MVKRIIAGILLWLAFLGSGYFLWDYAQHRYYEWRRKTLVADSKERWLQQRLRQWHYLSNPVDVQVVFDNWVWIRPGDKLYFKINEQRQEMGVVYAKREDPLTQKCLVYTRIYPDFDKFLRSDSVFVLRREPINPAWVVRTLLPTAKVEELKRQLASYLQGQSRRNKRIVDAAAYRNGSRGLCHFRKEFSQNHGQL